MLVKSKERKNKTDICRYWFNIEDDVISIGFEENNNSHILVKDADEEQELMSLLKNIKAFDNDFYIRLMKALMRI